MTPETLILGALLMAIILIWLWPCEPESNLVMQVRFHSVFGWYWCIVAANNVELCHSQENYMSKRNALKTARKVAGNHMRVEVV